MTSEQLVAVLVALAGLVTAMGVLIGQIVQLRKEVDGRLSQLVEATRGAALKEGELRGRDHAKGDPQSAPGEPAF